MKNIPFSCDQETINIANKLAKKLGDIGRSGLIRLLIMERAKKEGIK